MNKNILWQAGIFVGVLLLLNLIFQTHISIIGSLLLTIALSFAFSFIQSRR